MKNIVSPLFFALRRSFIIVLMLLLLLLISCKQEEVNVYFTSNVGNFKISYIHISDDVDKIIDNYVNECAKNIMEYTTLTNIICESNREEDVINYIFTFATVDGEIVKAYNFNINTTEQIYLTVDDYSSYLDEVNQQLDVVITINDYGFINYIISLENEVITFLIPKIITHKDNINITVQLGKNHLKKGEEKEEKKKKIALTFDDSPSRSTKNLLKVLDELEIVCTFFILGCNIEANSEALALIRDCNHEIGNHFYSHHDLAKKTEYQVLKEFKETEALIYKYAKVYPRISRLPYGSYKKQTLLAIPTPVIQWSCDSLDWLNNTNYFDNVLKDIDEGGIILFHDFSKYRKETIIKLVNYLKDEGYEFTTVSEVIGYTSVELLRPHKLYFHG